MYKEVIEWEDIQSFDKFSVVKVRIICSDAENFLIIGSFTTVGWTVEGNDADVDKYNHWLLRWNQLDEQGNETLLKK